MPQLHFYVSEDVASRLREQAAARRLSVSRYVAEIVEAELHPGWPEGYLELLGSLKDFPDDVDGSAESLPQDSPRHFELL